MTSIIKGSTYELRILVSDQDGSELDLSPFNLHYRISKSVGTQPFLSLDSPDVASSGNAALVSLNSSTTKTLPVGLNYHELFLSSSGDYYVVLSDTINILDSQARRA